MEPNYSMVTLDNMYTCTQKPHTVRYMLINPLASHWHIKSNICWHYFRCSFKPDISTRLVAGVNEQQLTPVCAHSLTKRKCKRKCGLCACHTAKDKVKHTTSEDLVGQRENHNVLFIDDMLDCFSTVHNPCSKHSLLSLLTYSTTRMNSGA